MAVALLIASFGAAHRDGGAANDDVVSAGRVCDAADAATAILATTALDRLTASAGGRPAVADVDKRLRPSRRRSSCAPPSLSPVPLFARLYSSVLFPADSFVCRLVNIQY